MFEITKAEDVQLLKHTKVIFQKNKLIFNDDITQDEWKELGGQLKQVEGSVQFWIGDWARYGEKRWNWGQYTSPKVYDEISEITGLSRKTIKEYKSIADRTSSVRTDDLSFNHHKEVAKLTPEKQSEFLKRAVEEKLTTRELREEIRKHEIDVRDVELPDDKFRVIYADPPWMYGNSMPSYFTEQANHYKLMTVDEICAMNIQGMAEKDAVLFLWVTSPILEESFRVIDAWGFKYKTSFVWDKIKHNMGHYNSVRHEFLLVCTRGSCTPDNLKLFDSVQSIERTEHSKKPEEFREIIDAIYTHGKKLELFAREKKDGWTSYGNELSEI